jgi:hypothetical protein
MTETEHTPIGDTFTWEEVSIADFLYKVRDVAMDARDRLQVVIAEAQTVLDDHAVTRIAEQVAEGRKVLERLTKLGDDAQDAAELVASSDILPDHHALIPERSGLVRRDALNPLLEAGKRDRSDV